MGLKFGLLGFWLAGCASTPSTLSKSEAPAAHAARPAPVQASSEAPPAAAPAAPAVQVEPTFSERLQALRGAGLAPLADLLALRVTQTRPKMKLTEDEAKLAAQELLEELPSLPRARALLEVMPKATIELVRGVRERNVPRDEAERIASYLLQVRAELAMDNPSSFDESCSHVVGREWQDIDYRDEGMTWQRQQAIYAPKGVPNFKTTDNLRQFFRIESKAPYFQKLYQVKGSVL